MAAAPSESSFAPHKEPEPMDAMLLSVVLRLAMLALTCAVIAAGPHLIVRVLARWRHASIAPQAQASSLRLRT